VSGRRLAGLLVAAALLSVLTVASADDAPAPEADETPDAPQEDSKDLSVFVKELEEQPVFDITIHPWDARKGPDDAAVQVMVFSDFQCRPYCARGASIADGLVESYGDRVQIIFKNFPLHSDCNPTTSTTMHDRACSVALAAQCAREQELFWPFHDAIFASEELDEGSIERAARAAGLTIGPWRACLASDRPGEQVATQSQQGKDAGVSGTPTWYVNGRRMSGSFAGKVDAVVRYELAKVDSAAGSAP